jgi:fumarylacetoacetase
MSPSTSANDSTYNAHFGPHNIPFGIASITSTEASTLPPQVVTRISGHVIFLSALAQANYFTTPLSSSLPNIFAQATLNALAALPRSTIRSIRSTLTTLFTQTESLSETLAQLPPNSHFPIATVRMHLPLQIGDFTDFSVSRTHALRAGEAIMGKSFLPPAFHHFPLGYGGRSSSIVVSGTEIERPVGQMWNAEKDVVFGPSRAVDYELEVAAVVGKPVGMGKRVSMKDADEHIFGVSRDSSLVLIL